MKTRNRLVMYGDGMIIAAPNRLANKISIYMQNDPTRMCLDTCFIRTNTARNE
ncbi:MAG: hypothetical protein VXY06_00325 [Bacteroidota bacterium]|nr:hypothetical protein [Bacteroidota bacterium]